MQSVRIDLSAAAWRKSSYSNPDGGNCLEIADNIPGAVPVRDSKDPGGPVLVFTPTAWAAFRGGAVPTPPG
ncbi:DUF397 domain-containing protein [Streptomyces hesseae]|uniref:DUF397 domain-containing protein n=1 Tax=Streptomyces hesseae TaxID=3075519 RepID=A0ABU2SPM2_9ACTN|nr:DUF397 domain-containing protein [Streptomyces sp. DSM 40473]MDT0450942.1 DUF397 domain-containing protein [Streptomyces sp. DSM 40473]